MTIGPFQNVRNAPILENPIATPFINSVGVVANRFFKNNPWKLSPDTGYQKIYRSCVVCGVNRFNNEDWETLGSTVGWGQVLTNCCRRLTCYQELDRHKGIPRALQIIENSAEQLHVNDTKEQEAEHFEEIDDVTFTHPFSTGNTEEMPVEYLKKFQEFDILPLTRRLQKINDMHFDYLKAHHLPPRMWVAAKDESDPFLKRLAFFRERLTDLSAHEGRMNEIQWIANKFTSKL